MLLLHDIQVFIGGPFDLDTRGNIVPSGDFGGNPIAAGEKSGDLFWKLYGDGGGSMGLMMSHGLGIIVGLEREDENFRGLCKPSKSG